MYSFKVLCSLILCIFCVFTYGEIKVEYEQNFNPFFRNDYHYIEDTESFYKIHTLHKSWRDAKKMCALEGATLFYPENKNEADTVMAYLKETQPFDWVFIGISDIMSTGVYETVDGVPVSDVYHNWEQGEPNGGHPENCAILRRESVMGDLSCTKRYPFICKKTLDSLKWNTECNMPNTDYSYYGAVSRCYKFHLSPANWTDAYAVCSAEKSYLAVINSQEEADLLVNITAAAPKDNVDGSYLRGAVHLGFHNRDNEGWTTIKGGALTDSGYPKWGYTQPDGKGEEKCGSMFYAGQLNDIGCDRRMFFICEHEPYSNALLDARFGMSNEIF